MVTIDLLRGALLADPPDPAWLLELARKLRQEILRGDMTLGILAPDAPEVAAEGLRRAAEGGRKEAWLDIGDWLARGIDTPAAPLPALTAFRRAAEDGSREARLALLSHLYFRLREPQYAEEAAALVPGLLDPDPDGAGHLLAGYLTLVGFGLPEDPAESVRLHREAARRGSRSAMFEMYVLLSTGTGVARDDAEALQYCRQAAELGHPRAAYNMGAFHATGLDELVVKDLGAAAMWYERASGLGNGRASAMLGYMYLVGDGVAMDEHKANEWFGVADEQGFDVTEFLESLGIETA
jgi:TPR repeat protein